MDGSLSWQASLARKNINILNIDFNEHRTTATVYYEFMYRPYNGSIKWCKTFTDIHGKVSREKDFGEFYLPIEGEDILRKLSDEALSLRKELER